MMPWKIFELKNLELLHQISILKKERRKVRTLRHVSQKCGKLIMLVLLLLVNIRQILLHHNKKWTILTLVNMYWKRSGEEGMDGDYEDPKLYTITTTTISRLQIHYPLLFLLSHIIFEILRNLVVNLRTFFSRTINITHCEEQSCFPTKK